MRQQSQVQEISATYALGDRAKVTSSKDATEFLRPKYYDIEEKESFYVLALSRANEIISYKMISTGGMNGTVADPKTIFNFALTTKGCAGIIIAHNHPSGKLVASESDLRLTKQVKEGGRILELNVLDHLILSPLGTYLSLADEGLF